MSMMTKLKGALLVGAMMVAPAAQAAPIDVTYTVSGSSGNWTYDFSLTNNLGGGNLIYFFGVQLQGHNIAGAPAGWNGNVWASWNPLTDDGAGPNITFDNNWINFGSTFGTGQTLSGFKATSSLSSPLDPVSWFAYATGGTYSGPGAFRTGGNPGFTGTATSGVAAVPEPATWAMMLAGFGAVGFAMRTRSRTSVNKVQFA